MLTNIILELDELHERLKTRYAQIRNNMRVSGLNGSAYIEETGKMYGIEECIEEIAFTRNKVQELIGDFLQDTIDGNYTLKMATLNRELELLNDKLYLKDLDLKKYEKIKEKANDIPKDELIDKKEKPLE